MPLYIFGPTQQAEFNTLRGLGYTGSLNDMQFAYLRDQGFFNALNDMLFGGVALPPALSPLSGNLTENSAAGTVIATLNYTPLSITNVNPAGWLALSGNQLVAGATPAFLS